MLKISILIPAYNEEQSIITLLEEVKKQKFSDVTFEVIVVDDGSKDNTVKLLKSRPDLYSKLYCMPTNQGKGAAVKAGLDLATGDYILFQDADLEYDPAEYEKLIIPIQRFSADVVIGSRLIAPQYIRIHYFWNKIGNQIITLIFNLLFNKTFTDIYTCYFMFRKNLLIPSELQTNGWEQQAEILARVIKRGKAFYEVPISYHGRTYEEGKKIRPIHALIVIWTIIKYRFKKT